jgi:hydroxyacylglutathione hydrolase
VISGGTSYTLRALFKTVAATPFFHPPECPAFVLILNDFVIAKQIVALASRTANFKSLQPSFTCLIEGRIVRSDAPLNKFNGSSIIPLNLSATNCFLAKAGDRYVLIDTGFEDDWHLFLRRLKEAHVELSQISHIILTHHHNDHSGLLCNILRENDSISVVMSQLCKELIVKGENDTTHGRYIVNRRIAVLMRGWRLLLSLLLKKVIPKEKVNTFPPYQVRGRDIVVTEDAGLRGIGIALEGKIIGTPGHTVDSISLLFDDGDCLIGDTAANVNVFQFLGAKYCPHVITDLSAVYNSWEKVSAAGAKWIWPAHGPSFVVEKLKTNLRKNEPESLVSYPLG